MAIESRRESRLSIQEVSNLLGVHCSTVERWIRSGVRGRVLPSVLVGGRRYVQREAIELFENQGKLPETTTDAKRLQKAQNELAELGVGTQRIKKGERA
jgi:excisionase family DNA binding protein